MSGAAHPAAAGIWQVGDVIAGLYRVTKVHEHGGMGLVYRVRHLGWDTDLALKSPRPQQLRSAEDQQRFVDEAQAWISLGLHPNVCAAHYVRAIDGVPRVFAEYVPGGSLREAIDDGRLYEGTPDEVLARLLDVAVQLGWGLAHAHRRGLVHQDVKPANVLLDEAGTAKVTDFGLSRVGAPAAHPGPARPGIWAGPGVSMRVSAGGLTPDYASPEQAAGAPLSRRTDVWSYAVSVFELFTGGVVWSSGPSADVTLAEYLQYGPDDPAAPRMPAALAELLTSCLLDDPAARPGDLAEVADMIAAVYAAELGRAYPRTAPAEAGLRADELNNRALSLLDLDDTEAADAALRAALEADPHHLEAVFNAALLGWRRGDLTDDEAVAAVAAARATRPGHWLGAYLLAQVQLERGDLDAALPLLAEAAQRSPDDPQFAELLRRARAGELAAGGTAWPVPGERGERGERGGMTGLDLGPDGRVVLTALVDEPPPQRGLRAALFGGEHRRPSASIVNVDFPAGGRGPLSLRPGAFAHHFAVGPDDRLAAVGGSGDDAVVWDLERGLALRRLPGHGIFVTALRFSADGRVLASGSGGGSIRLWDPVTGACLATLTGHEREVHGLAWPADGSLLASVSSDRTLRLWDSRTGRCTAVLPHADRVSAVDLSPDGRYAVTGDYGGVVRIWRLAAEGGSCLHELQGHQGRVTAVSASGAGRFLTAGQDGILRLWDAASGRCLRTVEAHRDAVFRGLSTTQTVYVAARAGSDGRFAYSMSNDLRLRSWGLPTGYTAALQVCRPRPVSRLHEFDARFKQLLSGAEQAMGEERVPAALELMRQARAVPGHENAPEAVAAWQRLARSCGRTGLRGARLVRRIALDEPGSQRYWTPRVAVSTDGARALTSSPDDAMVLWDLATGRAERRLRTPEHRISVETLALTADARLAVAIDGYRRLLVWDLHRDGEPRLLATLSSTGSRVCLDRAGAYALTGTGSYTMLRRWDLAAGTELAAFHGRERLVSSTDGYSRMEPETLHGVCLSGDGRLALAAAQDGDVLRWDAVSGQPLGRLRGHDQRAECVAISPDGRFALSGAWDTTVRYWDLARGRCVRVLAGHTQPVDAVAFTGDGEFAVSAGRDHAVRVWRLRDGACVQVLDGHDGPVAGVGLGDDGWLAVSVTRESLSVWELDWELAADPATGPQGGRWWGRMRAGRGGGITT